MKGKLLVRAQLQDKDAQKTKPQAITSTSSSGAGCFSSQFLAHFPVPLQGFPTETVSFGNADTA